MSESNLKYSDASFFYRICKDFTKYLNRTHLKNFTSIGGSRWKMGSIALDPSMIFFDGIEGIKLTKTLTKPTSYADASGNVRVTSAGHGLSNGDKVDMIGKYAGTELAVSNVATDTFDIPIAYDTPSVGSSDKWGLAESEMVALVNASREFYYKTETDELVIYPNTSTNDPNDDEMIEMGEDKDIFINKILADANQELNSLITNHSTPIPKGMIGDNSSSIARSPEYDYILKKAECLLAYSGLCNADEDYEKADRLYAQVTNFDGTGIVDRINSGDIKLNYEASDVTHKGSIRRRTNIVAVAMGTDEGGVELVELSGEWSGIEYEEIGIVCQVIGAVGTCEVDITTSNSSGLHNVTKRVKVTGLMQPLAGGIYGRFEQGKTDMALGDSWVIYVRNSKPTNPKMGSVKLWR